MQALIAAWTTTEPYSTRINKIQNEGVGATKVRLNATSVKDDGDGIRDDLNGQAERDWFFAQLDGDDSPSKDTLDAVRGESVIDLD